MKEPPQWAWRAAGMFCGWGGAYGVFVGHRRTPDQYDWFWFLATAAIGLYWTFLPRDSQ